MPTVSTPAAIPSFIEDMLADRQSHVAAIAVIDATLSRVSTALGVADVTAAIAKPVPVKPATTTAMAPVAKRMGRPPGVAKAAAPVVAKKPRGKASKFGISAADFVLAFVNANKTSTTQEINKHWKASGRPGTADNSMSLLTKLKKLKRGPLPGGVRGSKYVVA